MEQLLLAIFLTFAVATVLNIVLKRLGISHIIGYIATGVVISCLFGFNGVNIGTLDLIGEFGIVFLMFTIGLDLSLSKIRNMKEVFLFNGAAQVLMSVAAIFPVAVYGFKLDVNTALIVSLAFSLSSTAIVLTYLKQSKDIVTPYGQKSMGILIFQDLAVIPILLLLSFLSNDSLALSVILTKTVLAAFAIILFMFTVGEKLVNSLLKYASQAQLEELFLGAVFAVVLGTALLAHAVGFTYSLGAFIAGMIIADTDFHVKAESDIASYKDLLLGVFFFGVGTKIDLQFFIFNLPGILTVFLLVLLFKGAVIYGIIRRNADRNTSAKTALALAQVGEFSFAIFALAASQGLLSAQDASFLILVSVISMILTPFIVHNIYKLSALFEKEFYESDTITPIGRRGHIIVAGYATVGRIVAADLEKAGVSFVIISDNLKHVLHARKLGHMAYFGHLNRRPVLASLMVDEAAAVVLTMNREATKRLIAAAVLAYSDQIDVIMNINEPEEQKHLRAVGQVTFVDASVAVSHLLVKQALNAEHANAVREDRPERQIQR